VSNDQSKLSERVSEARSRRNVGPDIVEAPAEVLDEGVAGDDNAGGAVRLKPSHRSKASLEAPMVGLQEVVRVGLCVVEGSRQQLVEDPGVDPVPVGGDLRR
jgi:hypothetical protein